MNAGSPLMSEILQQRKFIKFNVTFLRDTHQSLFIQLQRRTLTISKPTECVNGLEVLCIIVIIIIIIIIIYMQGIYTYIPETNCVPIEYSNAAILLLLFMVLISLVSVLNLLYFYSSTFRSMCAVHNMAVCCCSLTSCFPGMLRTYFLNDFEIVPVVPIITGISFGFTFHMRCISIVRSLYFRIFFASFLSTFLTPEIASLLTYMFHYYYYLHLYARCVYYYIPEAYYVCRLYNVAAVLWLQFMVQEMLAPMIRILYFYSSVFALTSMSFSVVP